MTATNHFDTIVVGGGLVGAAVAGGLAGLETGALARPLVLEMPLRPRRGQLLISERVPRFFTLRDAAGAANRRRHAADRRLARGRRLRRRDHAAGNRAPRLASPRALHLFPRLDAAQLARRKRPPLRARARHLAIRPLLDRGYRIPDNALHPVGDTIVCRCEELFAAELEAAAALGAPGPNQAKAFTRCGMGPCQGRSCGAALEAICARARGLAPGQVEHLRVRPPIRPVTLGELAGVEEETR